MDGNFKSTLHGNSDFTWQRPLHFIVPACFIMMSLSVIVVRTVPILRRIFIPYGKTRSAIRQSPYLLHWLSDVTVPKSWFWHYYLLSTILSGCSTVVLVLCITQSNYCVSSWLPTDAKTLILLAMMTIQGSRRLYESLFVFKGSSAKMWIGHYLVGCAFYVLMNIAVVTGKRSKAKVEEGVDLNLYDLNAIALFLTASIWQFHTHAILGSLRPAWSNSSAIYSPPPKTSLSFQLFLTPHYTAEILIYFSMAILAGNLTMFTAVIWVVTILSISSGETRIWAHQKFREQEWGRWNIIPYIY